jgi:hypothetical protein
MSARLAGALCLLMLAGCIEITAKDSGTDAGSRPDAGSISDAGSIADGGHFDAGTPDSGAIDSGPGDGGPVDGGNEPVDAGAPDSGSVTNPPDAGLVATSIVIAPANGHTAPGGTLQFTAVVEDQNGANMSGPFTFNWSVDPQAGSISSSGLLTAANTPGGPFNLSAQTAGLTGTATVTIDAPVGGCTSAQVGVWENITPQELNPQYWCGPGTCQPDATHIPTYGAHFAVVDHNNPGTLIMGTDSLGVWKTTACGAQGSWQKISPDGGDLDKGRQWTIAIDPTDSQTMYTTSGYGTEGFYKTTNGGQSWTQMFTQNVYDATGIAFVEKITLDPTPVTGHSHIVASFHSGCIGTPLPGATLDNNGQWGCFAESFDSGVTWSLTTAALPWEGLDGPGQTMVNATTWFYATNSGSGIWKTDTAGVTVDGGNAWYKVYDGNATGSVYISPEGYYYSSGQMSTDGDNWTPIPNCPSMYSVNGSTPIVQAGSNLYFASGPIGPYAFSAPLNPDGTLGSFTPLPYPNGTAIGGAGLDYDSTYFIIYSYNLTSGLWRLRIQ